MRLKLVFSSEKRIFLPTGYFSSIQGLIYNLFDKLSANWLHAAGFRYKKRFFKLFVFSEINEKAKFLKGKGFLFPDKISFYIASPIQGMLEEISGNLVSAQKFKLGYNEIVLESISPVMQPSCDSRELTVRTLSPVEVHSTVKKNNGSSFTYYYSPYEEEYFSLISENLKKKWEILNEKPCPYSIEICKSPEINYKQRVIIVKDTVVKGWKGKFLLKGDKELLSLAFDAGLGTKNSLGFGMIEQVT